MSISLTKNGKLRVVNIKTSHYKNVFTPLVSMTQRGLLVTLPKWFEKYYPKESIEVAKEYIYIVGEIPIGLVAHLDTVHSSAPFQLFRDQEQGVIWSPQGLGADDRAGIFAIMRLVEQGYRPSIILTTDEESGGGGATAVTIAYPQPKTPLNFLIEIDRMGEMEAVYYNCDSESFEEYITSFGFVTNFGTFSDIYILGPAWQIPSVNVSAGYYNEHTPIEYLVEGVLEETIAVVGKILADEPRTFECTYRRSSFYTVNTCDLCLKPSDDLITVPEEDHSFVYHFCPECVEKSNIVRKCRKCGKQFVSFDIGEVPYCEECEFGEE